MGENRIEKITIRSWPKMVFSWPIGAAALGTGFCSLIWPQYTTQLGCIFLGIFGLVTIILSIEFRRIFSLVLFVAVTGSALMLIHAHQAHPSVASVFQWFQKREITATTDFYFIFSSIYFVVIVFGFFSTRLNYWQLTANELVHHKGFFSRAERFSTVGLKVSKEVNDLFSYFVGGAGRVILDIPSALKPVVLENVIKAKQVESGAEAILKGKLVHFESDLPPMPPMTIPGMPPTTPLSKDPIVTYQSINSRV